MGDTLYSSAMASAAVASPAAYFAKNSDRHPAEPQSVCIVPERSPATTTVAGGRTFDIADGGYAYLLSKPSGCAGGEMGINARGVAIGNESVSSRVKSDPEGAPGSDILRAALAASATAKEALDFICCFTEKKGQAGSGSAMAKPGHSNSYLIADAAGAFILETAGQRWAWRPANVVDSISNTYTIEEDYKRLDTQTRKEIAPVNEKAACSDEADPGRKGVKESWKARFENRLPLRFNKGEVRRAASLAALDSHRGKIGLSAVFGILRSHAGDDPSHPSRGRKESLCMHGGLDLVNQATTASLVVEYRADGDALIWFTGTSLPCVSLYKPVLLSGGIFIPLWTGYDYAEDASTSLEYWKTQGTRFATGAGKKAPPAKRDELQERLIDLVSPPIEVQRGRGDSSPSLDGLREKVDAIVAEWEGLQG